MWPAPEQYSGSLRTPGKRYEKKCHHALALVVETEASTPARTAVAAGGTEVASTVFVLERGVLCCSSRVPRYSRSVSVTSVVGYDRLPKPPTGGFLLDFIGFFGTLAGKTTNCFSLLRLGV